MEKHITEELLEEYEKHLSTPRLSGQSTEIRLSYIV